MATNIKQIQVGTQTLDLDAKYWNGHEWSDIGNVLKFIGASQSTAPTTGTYKKATINKTVYYIVVDTEASENKEVAAEKGDVFIDTTSSKEFLCTTAGLDVTSSWSEIGDQNLYATKAVAGQAGSYTSSTPSVNVTSSAGAEIAVGTATVTYKMAATVTGAAGAATVTTSSAHGEATADTDVAGAATINFGNATFTGTAATITVEAEAVELQDHSYTPEGSVSAVSAASHSHSISATTSTITNNVTGTQTGEAGKHTHTVDSHEHANNQTVLTSATSYVQAGDDSFDAGSLPTLTITDKATMAQMTSTTTVNVVTSIKGGEASGTTTVNTGYTHADPVFSTTSVVTGYPNFSGGSASGTFVTSAISDVQLSASETSTDGPAYVESVTHTAASLTGDTTFVKSIANWNGGSLNAATAINAVTGATLSEAGAHIHTVEVNSHTHGDDVSASKVDSYTAPSMTAINFTANTPSSASINTWGFAASIPNGSNNGVMYAPTVNADGVLSWSTAAAVTKDTFTQGSAASLTGGSFDAGTFTYSDVTAAGVKSAATLTATVSEAGAHTHTVNAATASVVPSYTLTGATCTITGGSIGISGGSISATTKYMKRTKTDASTDSVSWTAASLGTASTANAYTGIATAGGITSAGTATVVTGVTKAAIDNTEKLTPISIGSASSWNAGSLPTFTPGAKATFTPKTASVAGAASAATLTSSEVAAHTHSLTNSKLDYISTVSANTGLAGAFTVTPTFTGTAATISHTFATTTATVSMSGSYTPAGEISGTQTINAHSHGYVKPANHTHSVTITDHTHSIALTDTKITGTAAVAVSAHTHDMGNHTHSVTIPNCQSSAA